MKRFASNALWVLAKALLGAALVVLIPLAAGLILATALCMDAWESAEGLRAS